MGHARSRYAEQMNGERTLADFIPYSTHVSPNTLVTKEGDFLRIWKVAGIAHETSDSEDIQRRLDELNGLYRGMASNQIAVWTHIVRRRLSDKLRYGFDQPFCASLDGRYYESFTGYRMMANELYFTLVYRPMGSRMDRVARRAARRSIQEILDDQAAAIRKLDEMSMELESGMSAYGFQALGVYRDEHGSDCSEVLEFLNFLISGEWQSVRLPKGPIDSAIGGGYLFVGAETTEIRTASTRRFAQLIDLKEYPEYSEPGMLTDLLYENYEFVVTHSFSFMARMEGEKYLKKQQNQLKATEDGSITQIVEIVQAIDQLTQGLFAMGEYHFSMMIFGEDVAKVIANRASAVTAIKKRGFIPVLVATATDAAFYAQLPCNWAYRPRIAGITSLNFAGLAPLHNFPAGKRDGNPWGQAVTMFQTPSLQPFYFNFHASKDGEDAFDKKVLGNTRIIGASGTGKTALLGWLLIELQKYRIGSPTGFTTIYFDKDRGAELLIRSIGGKYLAIKNGIPTGFQPFQMEPTPANIAFLEQWVGDRCRGEVSAGVRERLTAMEEQRISHAVRAVMKMPKPMRRLSTVLQNMTEGLTVQEQSNSLVQRLRKWCSNGALGWVADNPTDLLDFEAAANIGIDGTDFLDNDLVRDAISSYLLHRMKSVIDGRRLVYIMDEAWKWVSGDSEAFSEFAGDMQLTIRKQNGLGVFATQMPSSLLTSPIAASLVQQVATEIYLPNPRADEGEYVNGFKVTAAEFEIIRTMAEDSRHFLVKQGQRSALARFSLDDVVDATGAVQSSFSDDLAILSGSADNLELLDQLMVEVGEDPAAWLPLFHERRRARKTIHKKEVRS